tara:strand:+ start:567 stop:1370 length:804 start_codon:yes stop_codon:yes gene_type:complete
VDNVVNRQDLVKEKFNWEVPVEAVPIPSEGAVYSESSGLNNKKLVEIRAMTTQEEDILSSPALIKQGTVITHLLSSCLVDKSIDVNEMLIGDRNALMVAVRITGYGADYTVNASCPSCTRTSEQTFDLAQLEIKRLAISPVVEGHNVFEFKLPVTGKTVHFRFLSGRDEVERSIMLERMRKMTGGMGIEKGVTSRLEYQIVAVEGVEDRNTVVQFISKMPAQDSRKLRAFISKHEPGIDMRGFISCPHCSYKGGVALPIGATFFWPS